SYVDELVTRLNTPIMVLEPGTVHGTLHVPPDRPAGEPESAARSVSSSSSAPASSQQSSQEKAALAPAEGGDAQNPPPPVAPDEGSGSPWYVDVDAMGEATIREFDSWRDEDVRPWADNVAEGTR